MALVLMLSGCETTSSHSTGSATGNLKSNESYDYIQPKQAARPGTRFISRTDSFIWPVKGALRSKFGDKTNRNRNDGIDIIATEGDSVKASRAGKVVYCDPHHKGYGMTIILDHGDRFQTVYSNNSSILVNVGDVVNQSAVIARIGNTGWAKEPGLHFEIRKDGVPQNPMKHLPH